MLLSADSDDCSLGAKSDESSASDAWSDSESDPYRLFFFFWTGFFVFLAVAVFGFGLDFSLGAFFTGVFKDSFLGDSGFTFSGLPFSALTFFVDLFSTTFAASFFGSLLVIYSLLRFLVSYFGAGVVDLPLRV